jgi:hypothetical protein
MNKKIFSNNDTSTVNTISFHSMFYLIRIMFSDEPVLLNKPTNHIRNKLLTYKLSVKYSNRTILDNVNKSHYNQKHIQ